MVTRRRAAFALFALLTFFLAGCGGGEGVTNTPPTPSALKGVWKGQIDADRSLSLTLNEAAGAVTGSGSVTFQSGGTFPASVSGTAAPDGKVELSIVYPGIHGGCGSIVGCPTGGTGTTFAGALANGILSGSYTWQEVYQLTLRKQ